MACNPKQRTQVSPTKPQTQTPVDPGVDPKDGGVVEVGDPDSLPDSTKLDELDPTKVPDLDLPVGRDGAVVSVMMPFFGNRYTSTTGTLPQNSDWALQYYAGLQLGLRALDRAGERATLHIFDTEGNPGTAQRLLEDPDLRNSHAIIGPYLTKTARAAATPAKAGKYPFLVPYSAASDLPKGYPRLVQFNPSLLAHLDGIAAYLHDHFRPEQVVLVGLPTGGQDQEVAYLLRQQRVLDTAGVAWRTWRLSTSDVGLQDLAWEDKFVEGEPTVFVFPEYRNQKVVLSFLSQLQVGRGKNDATVFGMPQWAEFNQLDAGVMEDLGVLITAGFHIDPSDFAVRTFTDNYVSAYGALPELPAYLGYDAIRYVVPLANRYGRAWPEHLPLQFDGLVSDYRCLGDGPDQPARNGATNRAVQVLRYADYRFGVVGE